jgi:hypothetical protein
MKQIKLNKKQFEWFNDCDSNFIFKQQLERHLSMMTDEEKIYFPFDKFIQDKTNELFLLFDYILVTEDNKIFGVKGKHLDYIITSEWAFESASQIH